MQPVLITSLSAVLVVCSTAATDAQPAPAFEVATIKPSGRDSPPTSLQRQPDGRVVTSNTALSFLIAWAFSVDESRLFGLPAGADSARFDVVAKIPSANLRPGELQMMMRSLLAERFGLLSHPEKRNLTSFVLVTDRDTVTIGLTIPPEKPDADPFSMTGAGVLTGRRVTMDMLAKVLSSQLGTAVENATSIAGSFDFTLQWQPDGIPIGDATTRPSLFTAIREQLGLRLDVRRVPVDVVVVDRVSLTPTPD
jgi:uncharacterized protein (TIGR03435 family)